MERIKYGDNANPVPMCVLTLVTLNFSTIIITHCDVSQCW